MQKVCRRCNVEQPVENFRGAYHVCRQCRSDYAIARWRAHRATQKAAAGPPESPSSDEDWPGSSAPAEVENGNDRQEPRSSGDEADEEDPEHLGSLYLMENSRIPGEIKVGRSRNPHHRARNLSVAHNFSLKLVATFPGEGRLEPHVHALLAEHRVPGASKEWFRVNRKRAFSAISHAMDNIH